MKIKNRLSLQFTAIVATMMAVVFSVLFWITEESRKTDFYARVKDRALTTAEIFLAQDNLTKEKFREVQKKYPQQLPDEIVRLYDSLGNYAFIKDITPYWTKDIVNKVRQDKYLEYQHGDRQTVGIYYMDNSGNFVVLASAVDDYGFTRQRELLLVLIAIFVITLFIMFMTGRIFAEVALSPINRVNLQVKNIQASNLNQRVDEGNGKDEISALAINFNNLLGRLQEAFEIQSSFVTNASHELRTPVTSIIGEIEVTLGKVREREDYQKSMQSILTEAERLKEITDNLLELAQVNFSITRLSSSPVRIDELLWDLRAEWMKKTEDSKLDLKFDDLPDDENKLVVNGNKQLLDMAISNILKNAFKFSGNEKVVCSLTQADHLITLSIADRGIGISEDDIPHIFQPFYRGNNARVYSGYGIGLSLTEKIIHIHHGTILVKSRIGEGAEFLVSLPSISP